LSNFYRNFPRVASFLSVLFLTACTGGGGNGGGGASNSPAPETTAGTYDIVWSGSVNLEGQSSPWIDHAVVSSGGDNFAALWTKSSNIVRTIQNSAATGLGNAATLPTAINTYSVSRPWLHADDSGNLTAIWAQTTGTEPSGLWTAHFDGTRWSSITKLNNAEYDGYSLASVSDGTGTIVAVWPEHAFAAPGYLVSRRYVPGSGWTAAELVDDISAYPSRCQVVLDAGGTATVVWVSTHSTSTRSLWARQYIPGTGWGAPVEVYATSAGLIDPYLTVDASGNATLAWTESMDVGKLWVLRYSPSGGWGTTAVLINGPDPVAIRSLQSDATGAVLLTWTRNSNNISTTSFLAGYYNPNSGWSTPTELAPSGIGMLGNTVVAAHDAAGNHMVTWKEFSNGTTRTRARRYEKVSGWTAPALLSANTWEPLNNQYLDDYLGRAIVDSLGNTTFVWPLRDGTRYTLWAQRYETAKGWSRPARIDGLANDDSLKARLAIGSSGKIVVTWLQISSDKAKWALWLRQFTPI
jgi:hypothetical protein